MFQRNKKNRTINEIFAKYISDNQLIIQDELDFLYDLVQYYRPKNVKTIVSINELLGYLSTHPLHSTLLSQYLQNVLNNRKFGRMLSDVGIWQDTAFFEEIKKRISAKILPFQPEKNTMEYVLNQVFYKYSDSQWVKNIPFSELQELFVMLGFSDIFSQSSVKQGALSELLYAIGLLTQRMGGRSLESYIIKMVPEYNHLENPFLSLEDELDELRQELILRPQAIHSDSLNYKQIIILHKQCQEFVNQAFKNSSKYGITLKVSQGLSCISQQLDRVDILLNLLVADNQEHQKDNSIKMALKLIQYNCYKNDVSTFLKDSIQSVSYEITQHTATTGEKYITDSSSEYFKMLKASLGGGLIVGFLCIFKVLLSKVDTSDFGYAFLYSMNYALGFIAIYLLHFTLATKQPAMTATTIIRAIEEGIKNNSTQKYGAFANLFARLFRSQFIAFVGNIVMAFPVALILVSVFDWVIGKNIVGQGKWQTLLDDANPTASPLIIHAGIAGVFLFLSGIISGNISNKNKHNQVYYRIAENPFLKRTFGANKAQKLSLWLENKWPGIASNFWFGVFMGTTASVGAFLGLNLDIRHITFVSGNIALGVYGADFLLDAMTWFWVFVGMILVGLVNFSVSFGLSLSLAFQSRNIPWTEVFALTQSVWLHFKKNPLSFFFPPKQNTNTDDAQSLSKA